MKKQSLIASTDKLSILQKKYKANYQRYHRCFASGDLARLLHHVIIIFIMTKNRFLYTFFTKYSIITKLLIFFK